MLSHTINLTTALNIFEHHLHDIKNAVAENMLHLIEQVPKPRKVDDIYEQELCNDLYTLEVEGIVEPRKRVIKRIVTKLQSKDGRTPAGTITDEMKEQAKEVPIAELYDGRLFRAGRRLTGCCPWHDERTPSFFINTDNTWHCFGACGEHGDSISFVMKRDGVGFKEAVRRLLRS